MKLNICEKEKLQLTENSQRNEKKKIKKKIHTKEKYKTIREKKQDLVEKKIRIAIEREKRINDLK